MDVGLILLLISLNLGISTLSLGYIILLIGEGIKVSKLETKAREMMNKISWKKCLTGKVSDADREIFAELSISNKMVISILTWTLPFGIVIVLFLYYINYIFEKYNLNPYLYFSVVHSTIVLLILPVTIYLIISLIARNVKSDENR